MPWHASAGSAWVPEVSERLLEAGPWHFLPVVRGRWSEAILALAVAAIFLLVDGGMVAALFAAEGPPMVLVLPFLLLCGGLLAMAIMMGLLALALVAGRAAGRRCRWSSSTGVVDRVGLREWAGPFHRTWRFDAAEARVTFSSDEGLGVHGAGPGEARSTWSGPSLLPGFDEGRAESWAHALGLAIGPAGRSRRAGGYRWTATEDSWELTATGWTAGPLTLVALGSLFLAFVGIAVALEGPASSLEGEAAAFLSVFLLAGGLLLRMGWMRARDRATLRFVGGELHLARRGRAVGRCRLVDGTIEVRGGTGRPGSGGGYHWGLVAPTTEGPFTWRLPCGVEGHRAAARWIERHPPALPHASEAS